MEGARPALPGGLSLLLAAGLTAVALFVYVNGAFFSNVSALHVDFSINWTAAHALRDRDNPYGPATLLERARDLEAPTNLLYHGLYTSYIQPPTSALSLLPLTYLPWREASRLYLGVNVVLLAATAAFAVRLVRPALPAPWVIAIAATVVAAFSQIYTSLALGQVDATMAFLFLAGFWAYQRRRLGLAGGIVAVGASIKLIPGFLLLYFLWKREYRVVLWAAGVGLALFALSLPFAGPEVYRDYIRDVLPALAKGSSHYMNISAIGAISRVFITGKIADLLVIFYLDELPTRVEVRVLSALTVLAGMAFLAYLIPRDRPAGGRPFAEFYLVVAVALLIENVTWEFYVIWLLPAFLAAALAPQRLFPPGRARAPLLALFAVAFLGLNYPGEFLFEPNGVFYHPEWVPGFWLERRLGLYADYLEWVPRIRIAALTLLVLLLATPALAERRASARGPLAPS